MHGSDIRDCGAVEKREIAAVAYGSFAMTSLAHFLLYAS